MGASECWLPVPGWEGLYEVSDLGRVRSLDRQIVVRGPGGRPGIQRHRGKVLRQPIRKDGYPQVTLSRAGEQKIFLVHILVLEAFVGPRPPGQEARHRPGGKGDPGLANLRGWGTKKQNFADRIEDGQGNRGERHGNAKVTTAMVLEIRARVAAGERQADVARDLGVGRTNVWAIAHRKNWQHV